MTIKEFAYKYTLPYHLVYKASFTIQPVATLIRDRDYREEDLIKETRTYVKRRLRDIKGQYEQYAAALGKLKNE